ncbi:hypothetical protein HHK36_025261 [Tetracentron sinense]|uniref:Uncharacterized protein n=1 Tax=Tetracentron sinense TaxID=13715 RepID=A0A834YKJ1_TETSI|nr:hypothetical protein HHK36_025261 [Tetracentron sinense]
MRTSTDLGSNLNISPAKASDSGETENWEAMKEASLSIVVSDSWKLQKQNLLRVTPNLHGCSKAGKCFVTALYQFHLVKAETARAFIPKEFRLVEAFGYTLGGFFLAHYDDSPAGIFDERVKAISKQPRNNKSNSFLNMIGIGTAFCKSEDRMDIQVTEITDSASTNFCSINLEAAVPETESNNKWLGPVIKMSLPSFSGQTEYNPHLLKYSCQMEGRVRAVKPVKVSGPTPAQKIGDTSSDPQYVNSVETANGVVGEDDARNRSISVLLSKPILALEFNRLKMHVEAPIVVPDCSKNTS